jgi:opacity protein-like surface antigen
MRSSTERTGMFRFPLTSTYALLAGWLLVQPAGAADLYFAGGIGNSAGGGDANASSDFYDVGSDDVDSSPAYGGSFGLAFAMDEAVPQLQTFELPSWTVRTELEFLMGRDYELSTAAVGAGDHFLSEIDAWTLIPNVTVEVPVRSAVSWLFGRIPILEPMNVYGNIGIGAAHVDLHASDNASSGSSSGLEFAWQGGAGITYTLTDTTTFQLGWRYLSLGNLETDLSGIQGGGKYEIDFSSQEVVTGLRVNFYTAPLVDMHPRHWRAPQVSLPSWLGGGDEEDAKPESEDPDDL